MFPRNHLAEEHDNEHACKIPLPQRIKKAGTTFVPICLPGALLKYTCNCVLGSSGQTNWEVHLSEGDVNVKEMQGYPEVAVA